MILRIQAGMGFIAIEIFDPLALGTLRPLGGVFALCPPSGIWIGWTFTFFLPLAFLVRVDISHTVGAVHQLNTAKADALRPCGLYDICLSLLQFQLPFAQDHALLEPGQCGRVWRRLVHAQSREVFG